MSDDILHTGRADIHRPKGPLTGQAAQQPLSRDDGLRDRIIAILDRYERHAGRGPDDDIPAAAAEDVMAQVAAEVARVRAAVAAEIADAIEEDIATLHAVGDQEWGAATITGLREALRHVRGHSAAPSVRPDADRTRCGCRADEEHAIVSAAFAPGGHLDQVEGRTGSAGADRTPDVDTPDHPGAQRLDPDRLRAAMAEELDALRQPPAEEAL